MGSLISRWASRLDAFSGYPIQTWLISSAVGTTTDTPEVCSLRSSRTRSDSSQAPICHYALRTISNRAEGTFARLRYSLGGDRPSQTTHLTLFPSRITASG